MPGARVISGVSGGTTAPRFRGSRMSRATSTGAVEGATSAPGRRVPAWAIVAVCSAGCGRLLR
jgi:hypothetical protein